MRSLLLNSSPLNSKIWNACVRGLASQSAVQSLPGIDRYSTLGQRWQQHENQILIAGVDKQELELEKAGIAITELTRREKWEEIENYCHVNGINRSAEQCRQRWHRLSHAVSKIKHWESCRPPGKSSFWSMKTSEKKSEGLLFSLDLETFNAIDVIQSRNEVACRTTDFSDAEAVSPESPSSEVNGQQQIMDIEAQQGTQETTASITNDQGVHAPNQESSNTWMEVAHETNSAGTEDRPLLFVNAINECLSYLKDMVFDPGEPLKAQADRGCGTDTQSKSAKSTNKDSSGQ